MPDKDRIVDEVRTALDALYPDPNHGNGNFGTSEVLTALCKACRACDPASFLCTKKKDVTAVAVNNGEWLYDLTCLIYDGDGYLNHIPLVAECEWGNQDQVYDDFQKLLLARADVRVMVFDSRQWEPDEDKFAELENYIRKCAHTQLGDT